MKNKDYLKLTKVLLASIQLTHIIHRIFYF